jgi:hypothetical protein
VKRSRLPVLSLLALLFVLFAACSGGAAGPPLTDVGTTAGGPNDNGTQERPVAPAATQAPAPQSNPGAPTDQQLIIYTGTLDLEVADVGSTVAQASQLIAGLGGHVASSEATDKSDRQFATVTYRIPAERWDEALTGLRPLGTRVISENTESEDVTGQVVDLDARIANLKSSELALQAIMARASSIPDVLKVQDELSGIQGDIESMTAQRDSLAGRAAFATLKVIFELPVLPETTVATGGWDLGHELDNAVAALVRVGQGITTLLIWVIVVVLPIVVPLLILLWIALWLRRRWLAAHPRPAHPAPPPWSPPL